MISLSFPFPNVESYLNKVYMRSVAISERYNVLCRSNQQVFRKPWVMVEEKSGPTAAGIPAAIKATILWWWVIDAVMRAES